jgi:hypothetical protein
VAIEAGTDVAALIGNWLQDPEGSCSTGVRGVAGGLEADDPGAVQPLDQRKLLAGVIEAWNLDSHD